MPGSPLIIEFAGLPGAGKTTASVSVIERLRAKGYRCEGRGPLTEGWGTRRDDRAGFRSWVLRHPAQPFALSRYAASVGFPGRSRRRYLSHLLYISYFLSEKIGDLDILVLDQSIVQTVWSLSIPGRAPGDRRIARVMNAVLGPFASSLGLVYFDIATERAADRIVRRAHGASRFDGMDHGATVSMLAQYAPTLERLSSGAERATGAPRFHLDATASIDECSSALMSFALGLLRNRGPLEPRGAG